MTDRQTDTQIERPEGDSIQKLRRAELQQLVSFTPECQHSVWSEPNVAIHTWSKVDAEKRKVRIRNLHTNRHTHTTLHITLLWNMCSWSA